MVTFTLEHITKAQRGVKV